MMMMKLEMRLFNKNASISLVEETLSWSQAFLECLKCKFVTLNPLAFRTVKTLQSFDCSERNVVKMCNMPKFWDTKNN